MVHEGDKAVFPQHVGTEGFHQEPIYGSHDSMLNTASKSLLGLLGLPMGGYIRE